MEAKQYLSSTSKEIGFPARDSFREDIIEQMVSEDNPEIDLYFCLSDHLGSSSFITDLSGAAVEHLQYMPFGESFIDQRGTGHDIRFKFTGKEKDSETGYSYFGARYYDSDISVWLSMDPLAGRYPGILGYAYVYNNPMNFIDPWGLEGVKDPNGNTGNAGEGYKQTKDKKYLYGDGLTTKKWDPNYDGGDSQADGTQKGGYVDYKGRDLNFEYYNNHCNSKVPIINGKEGMYSNEKVIDRVNLLNDFLNWADGLNQTTGYATSLTATALKQADAELQILNKFSSGTLIFGIAISAAKTDYSNKQSRIEFEIGTSLSLVAYKFPWAIPFAMSWSVIMIDKEYAKSLPERAAKGYQMSHDKIMNSPYFKNLK